MTEPTFSPPPQEALRKASPVRIILMLALGGPVLAVGGCALFLANLQLEGNNSASQTLALFGALLFGGGVLAFVVGCIWALVRLFTRRSPAVED
jgi:hypothetical protein